MSDGPPADRPGGRTFSIEGRPAAGLYLAGWMLSGLGLAVLFVAFQAGPPAGGVLIMAGLLLLTLGLAAAAGYQLLARRTRPADAYRGPSPLIVFGCLMFAVIAIGLAL
ncbi:MAG TPA: hypothetical protein VNW68_08275, partial [Candidatus Limnocylindria bacterium]|nr:hypothetical protein [Candidatus Limnocylindria bacterium]